MTILTLIVLYFIGGAIALYTVLGLVRKRERSRAMQSLTALRCPQCGGAYGDAVQHTATAVTYEWTPVRGHTASNLNLPRFTFLVPCPRCGAEHEFAREGRVFEHPQQGVLNYKRTGRLKVNPARHGRSLTQSRLWVR